jgi:hypothetical protein
MDLAKTQRKNGFVCTECGVLLTEKKLPRSFKMRSAMIVLIGLAFAVPADVIWMNSVLAGGAYFIAVVVSLVCLLHFWALPKDYRSCRLEVVRE